MFEPEELETATGALLALRHRPAEAPAKGAVQVLHGMAEHAGRYRRFAEALAVAGYHVYAHDHRGHGRTRAPDAEHGVFAVSDGWEKVIADAHSVTRHIRERHGENPIILFGHSMGAIIGLDYCTRHSGAIEAAALWNFSVDGGAMLGVFKALLKAERMLKGSDVPSRLALKLTFEAWNRKFAPNRTAFDWLSRDQAAVDKYIADPLCGFPVSVSLWLDVIDGIRNGSDDRALAKIRRDLPVHLLAGGADPAADNGRAVERLSRRLRRAGLDDISLTILPDNRHESLNELNHDETIAAFIGWLDAEFG